MLGIQEQVEEKILKSEDPLAAALLYARAGNYIDFGDLETVDEEKLMEILDKAISDHLLKKTYVRFLADLKNAGELVYLTDNCGEIVMDKLLVRELKRQYPNLHITVIVRGMPVLNDVTMEDAVFSGMDREAALISNGNGVAGTVVELLSPQARKVLEEADVILSKGQGNYESLSGYKGVVYYSFLCKCELFTSRFGVPRLTGMFVKEES